MTCKWNADAGEYLTADGEPCRTDDYGDPTKHCTARRTCSVHIGADELTCPRCLARVRTNLRRIPTLAAFALPIAIASGVNSPAAHIAGPSAHPVRWTWRRVDARRAAAAEHLTTDAWDELAFATAVERIEEDDDRHPAVVIRWAAMIAEDYGHDVPERFTVTSAADYLDRNLARIAQDDEQDFPLLGHDLRKCRRHLEAVESLSTHKERGAPCPECVADGVNAERLVREFGHWCADEACEKVNYDVRWDRDAQEFVPDPSGDVWVCPRDRAHQWTHEDYSRWVEERKGA